MFIPLWLIFLTSGTIMAVITVVWGIRHRQFDDQERARYLPLAGLTAEEMSRQPPIRRSASFWALMAIFLTGFVVMTMTIITVVRLL
jgi:nitrogen fixation-related uncharacterized protein